MESWFITHIHFLSFPEICLLKFGSLSSLPLTYIQKSKLDIRLFFKETRGTKSKHLLILTMRSLHKEKARSLLITLCFSSPGGMPCPRTQNFSLFQCLILKYTLTTTAGRKFEETLQTTRQRTNQKTNQKKTREFHKGVRGRKKPSNN